MRVVFGSYRVHRLAGVAKRDCRRSYAGALSADPRFRFGAHRYTDKYIPQPVRQQRIPKAGKPGEWRVLGIPTIYDRVCQQALLNPKFLLRLDASH